MRQPRLTFLTQCVLRLIASKPQIAQQRPFRHLHTSYTQSASKQMYDTHKYKRSKHDTSPYTPSLHLPHNLTLPLMLKLTLTFHDRAAVVQLMLTLKLRLRLKFRLRLRHNPNPKANSATRSSSHELVYPLMSTHISHAADEMLGYWGSGTVSIRMGSIHEGLRCYHLRG